MAHKSVKNTTSNPSFSMDRPSITSQGSLDSAGLVEFLDENFSLIKNEFGEWGLHMETEFLPKYWRNERKNIQCFPHCEEFGDYKLSRLNNNEHKRVPPSCKVSVHVNVHVPDVGIRYEDILVLGTIRHVDDVKNTKTTYTMEEIKLEQKKFNAVRGVCDKLDRKPNAVLQNAMFRICPQGQGKWSFGGELPKVRIAKKANAENLKPKFALVVELLCNNPNVLDPAITQSAKLTESQRDFKKPLDYNTYFVVAREMGSMFQMSTTRTLLRELGVDTGKKSKAGDKGKNAIQPARKRTKNHAIREFFGRVLFGVPSENVSDTLDPDKDHHAHDDDDDDDDNEGDDGWVEANNVAAADQHSNNDDGGAALTQAELNTKAAELAAAEGIASSGPTNKTDLRDVATYPDVQPNDFLAITVDHGDGVELNQVSKTSGEARSDVRGFLEENDLGMIADTLLENGYDTLERLLTLDKTELLEIGLKRGHANHLLKLISGGAVAGGTTSAASVAVPAPSVQISQSDAPDPGSSSTKPHAGIRKYVVPCLQSSRIRPFVMTVAALGFVFGVGLSGVLFHYLDVYAVAFSVSRGALATVLSFYVLSTLGLMAASIYMIRGKKMNPQFVSFVNVSEFVCFAFSVFFLIILFVLWNPQLKEAGLPKILLYICMSLSSGAGAAYFIIGTIFLMYACFKVNTVRNEQAVDAIPVA